MQPGAEVGAQVLEPVAVMAEAAERVGGGLGRTGGAGLAPVQRAAQVQGKEHREGGVLQAGPALLGQAQCQLLAREAAREARLGGGHPPAPVGAAGQGQQQEDREGNQNQQKPLAEVGNSFAFTVHHLMWNVKSGIIVCFARLIFALCTLHFIFLLSVHRVR